MDDSVKEETPYFEYIPDPYEKYYYSLGKHYTTAYGWDIPWPYYDDDDDESFSQEVCSYANSIPHKCQCVKCHRIYDDNDVFPVKAKDYEGVRYYCLDCVGTGITWCKRCGEPFEVENETDEICPDCAGKKRTIHTIT